MTLRTSLQSVAAIEVKKLQRQANGRIARATGLDYNTTPPCGTVRIYEQGGRQEIDVRGFYLFACQEDAPSSPGSHILTALALCDGNLLNDDFNHYLAIVGLRSKTTGLGTYGDGVNRDRPMLLYANPLGAAALDFAATLVHSRDDLETQNRQLRHVGVIRRTTVSGGVNEFHCYRTVQDVPSGWQPFRLSDPFPNPSSRTTATRPRGRFILPVRTTP